MSESVVVVFLLFFFAIIERALSRNRMIEKVFTFFGLRRIYIINTSSQCVVVVVVFEFECLITGSLEISKSRPGKYRALYKYRESKGISDSTHIIVFHFYLIVLLF